MSSAPSPRHPQKPLCLTRLPCAWPSFSTKVPDSTKPRLHGIWQKSLEVEFFLLALPGFLVFSVEFGLWLSIPTTSSSIFAGFDDSRTAQCRCFCHFFLVSDDDMPSRFGYGLAARCFGQPYHRFPGWDQTCAKANGRDLCHLNLIFQWQNMTKQTSSYLNLYFRCYCPKDFHKSSQLIKSSNIYKALGIEKLGWCPSFTVYQVTSSPKCDPPVPPTLYGPRLEQAQASGRCRWAKSPILCLQGHWKKVPHVLRLRSLKTV